MSPSKLEAVTAILHLCSRIGTVADLSEMLTTAADALASLLPADRVSIVEFDLERRRLGQFVAGGPGAGKARAGIEFEELWEGLSGRALRERKSVLSPKSLAGAGSVIVVPFLFQGRVLGTMTAVNAPEQRNFTKRDAATLELFANVCAPALENARLLLQVEESRKLLMDENDLKDRLFAVLAHDLRGPLAGLQSTLRMISDRFDETELARELLGQGVQSVDRTYALTENLLTWIRGQIRGIQLPTRRVVLTELLKTVQEAVESQAAGKRVTVTVTARPSLALDTEPDAMRAILRNLVSNAVKFSRPGSEVLVTAERDGPEVIFEVRDFGEGMTEEQVALLFRGRPVTPQPGTEGEQGNGLGLMFSSDLAKSVGGWLEASSLPGAGSTVRLIVADADPEEL